MLMSLMTVTVLDLTRQEGLDFYVLVNKFDVKNWGLVR